MPATPTSAASEVPRSRGAETAERILDAAEDCFARGGYEGTTLRDVAGAVGIRIPSLYNHFANKQALYDAVLERGIAPIRELLSRAIESEDEAGSDPAGTVAEVMGLLAARPNLPRLIQYEMLAGGEHLARIVEAWLRPTLQQSLEMLQATSASAHWKPEQLPYLLLAFYNIIVGHFAIAPLIDPLLGENPQAPEAVARATEFYGQIAALLTLGPAASATALRVSPDEPGCSSAS